MIVFMVVEVVQFFEKLKMEFLIELLEKIKVENRFFEGIEVLSFVIFDGKVG